MPPIVWSLSQARRNLARLVDSAAAGEEVIIVKNGIPLVRLVPVERRMLLRQPGGWEGRVTIAEDFDAKLPDDLLVGFGVP